MGNDAKPEFQAQTLPAGSAPADRTFQFVQFDSEPLHQQRLTYHRPNPDNESLPAQQSKSGSDAAQDTLIGASSADVHTGLGHPGSGQSSKELRHDGQSGRKAPGAGLEGVGATVQQDTIDAHDPAFAGQRALGKDEAVIGRSDVPSAEERLPEGAESVASERN